MEEIKEVDVRGLSCPEPVMLTMDAMDENLGKKIKVIVNEAHTRVNIERMLEHQGKQSCTAECGSHYEIVFEA